MVVIKICAYSEGKEAPHSCTICLALGTISFPEYDYLRFDLCTPKS